jgi:predicted acylesterase/phospholipase RssA
MSQKRKIGIVLDGGGAKGAYQVGCWKAIRENKGYEVKAVAGSSVGALNAFLVATDRFEDCIAVWTALRPWHVLGIRIKTLLLLPGWFIALLLRLVQAPRNNIHGPDGDLLSSLYVAFVMFVFLTTEYRPFWLVPGIVFILLVLARQFGWLLRSVILNWGVTTNGPLSRTVRSLLDCQELGIGMPAYATLSRRERGVSEPKWYGWAPEYVRFDLMSHSTISEVLLASAALPGVFPVSTVLGYPAIDGGWCDNSPLAPLLFGTEEALDIIFVLHLGPVDPAPEVFPLEVGGRNPFNIWENRVLTPSETARQMWSAHQGVLRARAERRSRRNLIQTSSGNQANANSGTRAFRKEPIIIEVVPSESLGDFFSGTLGFSARKAKNLIVLGERDMLKILEGLERQESSASVV